MTLPGTGSPPDLLIVGAGVAGLACARDAVGAGLRVKVLDKSRGISGRAATRRITLEDGREARLDHGARFFTARHERTKTLVEAGLREGWLHEWTRTVSEWQGGEVRSTPDGHPRYAPAEGFSAMGRALARGLDVQTGTEVTSLERRGHGWRVHTRDGAHWDSPRLILNLPAPQVAALLEDHDIGDDAEAVARVRFDPCWAAGVVLEQDLVGHHWPALKLSGHPMLDWIAREHTKRAPGHPPALMLHAGADWSRANLERRPDEVLPELLDAAAEVLGQPLPHLHAFAHRWRYATPTARVPAPCHWDEELNLGWCGDWLTPDPHGPRVEAALLSGWRLAARVTKQ